MLSPKNIKFMEYSYNSYDDIGVLTIVLPWTVTLINKSLLYVGRIFFLINLITPSKCVQMTVPQFQKLINEKIFLILLLILLT
jgi:hypothetical protein